LAHAPSKPKPPKKREQQWAITLIRQRRKFLGYVKAPDQQTAIKEAMKHFAITDREQQRRLITQRSD